MDGSISVFLIVVLSSFWSPSYFKLLGDFWKSTNGDIKVSPNESGFMIPVCMPGHRSSIRCQSQWTVYWDKEMLTLQCIYFSPQIKFCGSEYKVEGYSIEKDGFPEML